jgi:branched-chain amino acid transport system ATP-binding protein
VHAVIGTNGAGKSTLINILSGEIPPSGGSVELLGQDVTGWSQPRRARAGLGRSYQRNTIYPEFTVLENCRLAAQARTQRPWAWWSDAQRCCAEQHGRAREAARAPAWTSCSSARPGCCRTARSASSRSPCAWPPRPQVLLLDEPLAGMGAEETERMLALLDRAEAPATPSCWSSTTWTRCSASPTASP